MLTDPDFGGFPPSTAVRSSLYVVVISLSTAFFRKSLSLMLINEITVPGLESSETTLESEVKSISGALSFMSIILIVTTDSTINGGWPLSDACTSNLYTSVSSKSSSPLI
ncbi:hypothetical protein PO909_007279 [Leuciscus waleckii]